MPFCSSYSTKAAHHVCLQRQGKLDSWPLTDAKGPKEDTDGTLLMSTSLVIGICGCWQNLGPTWLVRCQFDWQSILQLARFIHQWLDHVLSDDMDATWQNCLLMKRDYPLIWISNTVSDQSSYCDECLLKEQVGMSSSNWISFQPLSNFMGLT